MELYTEIHLFTDDQRNHNYHNIFIRAGFDGQTLKTTLIKSYYRHYVSSMKKSWLIDMVFTQDSNLLL